VARARWSALVPNERGARDAVAAGLNCVDYVVSASDSHGRANVGVITDRATAAAADVADVVHAADGHVEVIIATA
jgi:hydroxymethylglutaryl-CoA lyase